MAIHQDMFQQSATGETDFRRVCEELCNARPAQPRLKTIAAVGAYDATIGGQGVDSKRLTGIVTYLLQSGILIDPDFIVDAINFREKRDFLKEDQKADLVFVSLILARHVWRMHRMTYEYDDKIHDLAHRSEDYRSVLGLALSADHEMSIWQKRIETAGAKIIATYGGRDEIGTHNLFNADNAQNFRTVIETPGHHMGASGYVETREGDKAIGGYELRTKVSLSQLYNKAANDLPMPWLGFAASPAYLDSVKEGLSEETVLGFNAKKLVLTL